MTHTPFQRALNGLEDVIFRLPLHRRRQCLAFILRQHRRFLPARMNPAFVLETANYRDRQIVSIAQRHQLGGWRHLFDRAWLWWLWPLMVWNSLTNGVDVAEYALAWFVVTHRWMPRSVASWSMATAAIIASDLRLAPPSRVPVWCLASLRAPVIGAKVCAWNLGIVRWWKWGTSPTRESEPFDLSWLHGALRVGMGAAIWLLCWWGDQHLPHATHVLTAAISATMVWNVQTGGSDTFGGGYNGSGSSPGNDYSTGTAAHVVIDGTVISATVQATTTQLKFAGSSGYTTAASDNRNVLQITGGTATAGFYEISVVTAGIPGTGVWQVDRSMGTNGQTITGNMGGCLATYGAVAGSVVNSNTVFMLTGTYTMTTGTQNVSGGKINVGQQVRFEGYGVTPGDLVSPPTFKNGAFTSLAAVLNSGPIVNLIVDGNSQSTVTGVQGGSCYLCTVKNCTSNAYACSAIRSIATTNSGTGSFGNCNYVFACEAYANTVAGIRNGASGQAVVMSLSYANVGATVDGFNLPLNLEHIINCVSYNNGRDGYRIQNPDCELINCIAEGNTAVGAFGFSGGGAVRASVRLLNCAVFNNATNIDTTNLANTTGLIAGTITGGSSFFTNAAGNDFSLNNTASAGASLRAAGYPGLLPRGTTTSYLDVGAAQHADPAGGGGGVFIFGG